MELISKRLRPLFVADFFAGLMFYFAIVFPFMHKTGLTATQLGLYVIFSSVVILVVEVPSGILADRWSRKGVLMLGTVFLGIGSVVFGFAHSFGGFILGDLFTAVYFAVRSGMPEAMIYDSLLEQNNRQAYEKQLGRLRTVYTVGLVISSIAGAVVANFLGFPTPFFMSAVSCAAALFFLYRFKEPQLHRKDEAAKLFAHIALLFRSISQQREVRLLVITGIFVGIDFNYMMQLDPMWPLALGLATIWYGPLNALLLSSQGVAGLLADRAAKQSNQIRLVSFVLIASAAGLLLRNIFVIAFSEFALLAAATVLTIVLSGRVQDQLPSSQRSGVESAISTLSTVAFMGTVFVFSFIVRTQSVFIAAWILVVVAVFAVIGVFKSLLKQPRPRPSVRIT